MHVAELRERLRKALPEQLIPWPKEELQQDGLFGRDSAGHGREDFLRFRAGRHRQRGHELRLADARSR